jgi:hypothetical protein
LQFRLSDLAVFVSLVGAGAAARLALQDYPNFTPVAAISLFAGYYFRSAKWAVAVPLAIMLITDSVIGMYAPLLMASVYGMLALPVAARGLLRRVFRLETGSVGAAVASFCGLVGCGLLASVSFFLVTNFVCWLQGHGYEYTPAGFAQCYVQALPFFKNTLLGDLTFSLLLFGGYGAAVRWSAAQATAEPALSRG